jgi:putative transposase
MAIRPERADRRHFNRTDRIGIGLGTPNALYYRWIETVGDSYVLERVDQPGFHETLSFEKFEAIEASPGYRYDPRYFDAGRARARARSEVDSFADIPQVEHETVVWRLAWVTGFLELERQRRASRSDASMIAAISILQGEMTARNSAPAPGAPKPRAGATNTTRSPPGVRTLRRWVRAFERGGQSPTALRDNYRRCGRTPVAIIPELEEIESRNVVRYAAENRPTMIGLHRDYLIEVGELNRTRASAGLEPVKARSEKIFRKRINGLAEYDVFAGRFGIEAARKRFAVVSTGLDVTRPGQRIEIDEWQIPLQKLMIDAQIWETLDGDKQQMVVRARWYLSAAIDTASRCIVGMRLSTSADAETAIATLAMIVADKGSYSDAVGALSAWDMRCGIETIATDTGSAYISHAFYAAVLGAGGMVVHPPAGLAQMRARIERLFGTIHTQLVSRFTGRSFHNAVALAGYPSEARASMTPAEFSRALVRYVVDAYHNTPHSELNGETPRNAWTRLVKEYGTVPPPDADTRRKIFGMGFSRRLTTSGLRVLNLDYQSRDLQAHRRHVGDCTVEVKLDPDCLGWISVKLPGGWITVPCMMEGANQLNLPVWLETLEDLRRRHAAAAQIAWPTVLQAYDDIQKMSNAAVHRADIGSTMLSPDQLDLAERALSISWAPPPDAEAPAGQGDDADLSTGILGASGNAATPPKATPAPSGKPPANPETAPDTPDWTIED